ncbi:H-2 class II histocompatibility antigen, E-S beta chain-like [Hyperolius riggenbachi]|uniref:H-2 class II histocompatibility antigen, E-S beta chain-like n=1 Tax=Hyperolius riggenbachi TaxID=752182 RepID=UPI0035A34ED5
MSWLRASVFLAVFPALLSASPPEDFVYQMKCQCYFRNGTEDIKFLYRSVYNQEEIVYFDSDVGYFIARTELGRPDAEHWNSKPELLDLARSYRDNACKTNYAIDKDSIIDRKSEPRIKIIYTPSLNEAHQNILTCFVDNFLPFNIKVTWLKNGVEESEQVTSSELLDDGDWTYQIHVNLETPVNHKDTFTCRVEHSSLTTPMEVNWKYRIPEFAYNKKLIGIVGYVLGVVVFIAGLLVYLRNTRGFTFLHVQQHDLNEGENI